MNVFNEDGLEDLAKKVGEGVKFRPARVLLPVSRKDLAQYYRRETQILMGDCTHYHSIGDHAAAEIFWDAAKTYAQMARQVASK